MEGLAGQRTLVRPRRLKGGRKAQVLSREEESLREELINGNREAIQKRKEEGLIERNSIQKGEQRRGL